jgi:hypothetical protein
MTVDTKHATGRRELHFNSYEDVIADAEKLAAGDVTMVGNWSLGQIFKHLAIAYTGSIDGLPFNAPWFVKMMARMFMKKKFLYKSLPSGFQIPDKQRDHLVANDAISTDEGLVALKDAVARLQTESHRVLHPVFSKLTNEEWDNFHWRHAEMHMSFAAPKE